MTTSVKNQRSATAAKLALTTITTLILLLAALTALTVTTQAAPIYDLPTTVQQPDGIYLEAFVSGDSSFNYLHDSEGRIILQHPETGFWVYATLDSSGLLTASNRIAVSNGLFYDTDSGNRAYSVEPISTLGITTSDINFALNSHLIHDREAPEGHTDYAEHTRNGEQGIEPTSTGLNMVRANPISGTIENVVILITFACNPDPAITPSLSNTLQDRFNGLQFSLRSYMYAASYGQLNLNSTIIGMNNNTIVMYQDPQQRGYFMPFHHITNPIGYPTAEIGHTRGQQLLARAVEAIDGSTLLNGRVLNTINPSRVDSVTFVLTGDVSAWGNFLWPHRGTLNQQQVFLNDVRVIDYSLLMLGASPSYPHLRPSTIVHEQLHIFGMPDFYRYASATRPPGPVGEPVGRWDIMAGSLASNQTLMQFSNTHAIRRYVGWGDPPVEITQSGKFTLHPRGTPNQVTAFVIPVEGRPNEFILLEYRSSANPTSYDNFLATDTDFRAGLVISRINTTFRGNARSGDPAFQNGDASFRDEVYIFRPGTTVRNSGLSDVALASLSANSGRTSFGNAQGVGYLGIIYTHEGYNTGVEIYNVGIAGSTITFSVYLGGSVITPLSPEMALRAAVTAAGGTPTVIYLTQNIVLSEVLAPLVIPSGANVVLRSAGEATYSISAGGNFAVIDVGGNEFALTSYLVLDGVDITRLPGTNGRGINILRTGHLTLNSGIITGHNRGAVDNLGTFIMHGGAISSNTDNVNVNAGGVTNWGNFTMTGGTISGNTGVFGGGVRNSPITINDVRYVAVFNMNGGTISNNTSTGVDGGGGVRNNATFNLNDGVITGNSALRGGGVTNMLLEGVVTMTGGEISGNEATLAFPGGGGGGVLNMNGASFIMHNGLIASNTAHGNNAWGGGIANAASFVMHNGTIGNNSAFGNGGGIAITGTGTFTMNAGTMSNNIAGIGGGIGMAPAVLRNGQLNIGADAIFTGNDIFSFDAIFNQVRGRSPIDDDLYALHIHATQWSDPFTQGLNTFDISSHDGPFVFVRRIFFILNSTDANPTVPATIGQIRGIANTPVIDAPRFPADPTRVGYVFGGWFTNPTFTQPLTAASLVPVHTSLRLYARWIPIVSYDIRVLTDPYGGMWGTAAADVSTAPAGTVVNLTAMANDEFRFVEWQVYCGESATLLFRRLTPATTFIMPDHDIIVVARFDFIPEYHTITLLTQRYWWPIFSPYCPTLCCFIHLALTYDQWYLYFYAPGDVVREVLSVPHGYQIGFMTSLWAMPWWECVVSGRIYAGRQILLEPIYRSRVFAIFEPRTLF